jgi:mRNA interferase MazF
MTPYKRGDVVLVPFPFSNLSTTKKRPAVVISSTAYNESSLDIVILAITSKVEKSSGIGECLVQEWKSAGLLKPSAIKPALSTIEQTLALKKLGTLSAKDVQLPCHRGSRPAGSVRNN